MKKLGLRVVKQLTKAHRQEVAEIRVEPPLTNPRGTADLMETVWNQCLDSACLLVFCFVLFWWC